LREQDIGKCPASQKGWDALYGTGPYSNKPLLIEEYIKFSFEDPRSHDFFEFSVFLFKKMLARVREVCETLFFDIFEACRLKSNYNKDSGKWL
jgi:hypothetical protein